MTQAKDTKKPPPRTGARSTPPLPPVRLLKDYKHKSPLIGCRIDPSGRFIFVSAQDNSIQRWDIASGKPTPFVGHKSWVRALAFVPGGKILFSADWAGKLMTWPVEGDKPAPIRTVDAHKGWVRALAVSPDGKTLASCGNDHLVRLWSVADCKLLGQLEGHSCHVYNVVFHPDGKSLVSADLKGVVKQWDLAGRKMVKQLDAAVLYKYDPSFRADIGGVRSMAFSADGSLLACCGITDVSNAFAGVGKPLVVLFDMKTGKRTLLRPKTNFQGTAWGVKFRPDGILLGVGGGNGGALWLWKTDKADNYFTLGLPNNARDLDLHPDGKRLAVAFYDSAVRLYEMNG